MHRQFSPITFILLTAIITAALFPPALSAQAPLRVVIVPFQINAPPELSYLKHGIADMLTSRLTWENKVVVLRTKEPEKGAGQETISENTAREIGLSLQADRVLFGSLTALGQSISIDIRLIEPAGDKPAQTFFVQSPSLDEVIPKIDLLASQINEEVFGRTVAKKAAPSAPADSPKPVDESRMHPEKLIQQGFEDTGAAGQRDIFEKAPGLSPASASFWKSPNFDYLINGMCMGDVNGDGKPETIVASPNQVRIFSMDKGRFIEMDTIDLGSFVRIVGVDAADLNGNGIAEIFVSATTTVRSTAQSAVFEFNGGNYKQILENSPWFFRYVGMRSGNPVMLGQRISVLDPFSGEVSEMTWSSGELVPQGKISNKNRVNLIGFAMGDMLGNREEQFIAYDRGDRIQLMDKTGKIQWKGSDKLGGSTLTFSEPKEDKGAESFVYLPMRLITHDFNRDGKFEVVAVKNHELSRGTLEQFRVYTKSQFQFLSWDGLGLSLLRETRELSGFIRDYFIGDFDSDGNDELVAAVILKEGNIAFTEKKSAVIAFEIGDFLKQ